MNIGGITGFDPFASNAYRAGLVGGAAHGADNRPAEIVGAKASPSVENDAQLRAMKRAGMVECETCKNRKYQDGSDEGDVSFKAPGHISPQASRATVAAHESQHVANAYQKAGQQKGQVMQASVSFQMDICPECGRSYVAGGTTNTMIKYNKSTPYGDAKQASDAANGAIGANVDLAV